MELPASRYCFMFKDKESAVLSSDVETSEFVPVIGGSVNE
jgi:hypothetical protein